jgi:hypothetical protein
MGSGFLPRLAWIQSYFTLPTLARMTGVCHHAQLFFCWGEVSQTFLSPGWPETVIFLISVSQVATIIDEALTDTLMFGLELRLHCIH